MLTVLASLAFLAAALGAAVCMAAIFAAYRDVALRNLAALGEAGEHKDYHVLVTALGRKPVLVGQPGMRRTPVRAGAVRGPVRTSPARRAA